MKTTEGEITKTIEFRAAYDRRRDDPKKNCGIHGVDLLFVYRGPRGATQFVLFTNWHLPHVQLENDIRPAHPDYPYLLHNPIPSDLGYHAYEPQFEGQLRMGHCDILTDAPGGCFYDGSSLEAKRVFDRLTTEGEAGVWDELAQYYHELFVIATRK